ncbi:hypothetical protein BGZ54_005594 [Gamsiella multidivaricata]|nr:hypothetical protein BGZ54_005594 [Gamsiella multidivaricata]
MKVANVCAAQPLQPCVTSADCLNVAFSYCAVFNGSNVCTGTGIPGTDNECQQPADNSSVMSTLKFAGIAVGSVAALGVAFALVRWQRRRQRSKMPAEMFGEMDYGAPKAVESYPFSSRPNAHGNDHAPSPPGFNDGYDNHNQYYEEPVGYTNNMHAGKMHQDQYHGHDQYDNNQYYGNGQKDDGYGYSQHGGQTNDGYYDNTGYDEYPQHPIASPAAARAASPRHQNFNAMDGYGAEPSELDFGGHGHGQVAGHGGYGGGRY